MRVAFLGVADRGGNTTAVWLTAMALAYKQSKTVRVCYTGENHAIKRYLGIDEENTDITRSISQVSKLLQAHAVAPEELGTYCIKVGPNLELMDSWDPSLTEDEMAELLTFVYERSTADYTICDLAYGVDDPISQSILKASDIVVINSEPSMTSLRAVKEMMESNKSRKHKNKRLLLLINSYHQDIMPLKKCAGFAGFSLRDTCKVHWNPYLIRGANNQDLQSVVLRSFERDPRVVELNQDMKEVTQFLLAINHEKVRWED